MGLYESWCEATKERDKRKHYWTYAEKDAGRDEISGELAETIRPHYVRLERIAEDVERLGFKFAATSLSEPMAQTGRGPLRCHPRMAAYEPKRPGSASASAFWIRGTRSRAVRPAPINVADAAPVQLP